MNHFEHYAKAGGTRRTMAAVGCVVAVHAFGLWALQAGFLQQAVQVVIPVQVLSDFITPAPLPAPTPAPAPPPTAPPPPKAPPPPAPVRHAPSPRKAVAPKPAPMPVAIDDPTPAPDAPVGVTEPQPPAPAINEPVAPPPPAPVVAPAAPPAPAMVAPSSTASYLNNPAPAYPAISRRLNEQGLVVLRVLIGTDGQPQKVEVKQSSGFERLDQAAVKTVTRWRFTPGTRNGVPEAMWHLQPINFVLTH